MDKGAEAYKRYLAGDDEGIVTLVALYRSGLILYLTTLVKDVHLAEELTEDTFFKLMVKKPRYRDKGSFKAWLYAIARNLFIRQNAETGKTYKGVTGTFYFGDDGPYKFVNGLLVEET